MMGDLPLTSEKPSGRRRGIQSILTGFRVIDCLVAAREPIPLRQISEATGLSSSKLQFYLISLIEVGVVAQDKRSGHYGLGPYTLQLGITGLQQFDVLAALAGPMRDLAEETGQATYLGVWGSAGPTIIHRAPGSLSHQVFELRLGAVLPVLGSALGRLFMAYLPPALTDAALQSAFETLEQGPVRSAGEMPRNRAEAAELGARIRDQGVAHGAGLLLPDHAEISAPVVDHTGLILAGLTVIGHVNRLDVDPDGALSRQLRGIADRISAEAGANSHHYLPR